MGNIILTGDRPTGSLHIGHFVGSLSRRVELQNKGDYEKLFVMIADSQALTDNSGNPRKVRNNVIEVLLDYLSVGLDPEKTTFFIQSEIKALPELTAYYMNLVTLQRLMRNPTVKSEISMRGYEEKHIGTPVGFVNYPISQAADITAFKANIVPVGDDQLPMIEQTREIVRSFNNTYKEVLVLPEAVIPQNEVCKRLPGTDGNQKMSKSLGNCIYLVDSSEEVYKKVMNMYTDPTHIKVEDKGHLEGNVVFTYLDAFCKEEHFQKYLPEYANLDALKKHYTSGGLGDAKVKKFLYQILEEILTPIREKRKEYENNIELVYKILEEGTKEANKYTEETLKEVKDAIGLNYFNGNKFINEIKEKYGNIK